ncbi:hypothetical protein FNB79_09760 [Formosa sediminum]|uniref:Uncharacterized protein n=1 Tax=Formosa sediminum TaxID=2594004 RepID=A0A516GRV3_9FLAO|nr:hypothetical protein [Formosa sediminum]QDO94244.1 hypothetical protein FNB79_09760 [Formosa sediminum]
MNEQITDTITQKVIDSLPKAVTDTLANNVPNPIQVELIENSDKIDWNVWFLLIAVLTLITAVIIPFAQKKYEERKSKFGFHLYVKKKLGIVWNLLTYDKLEYKQPRSAEKMDDELLTFDKLIYKFEKDFKENKNTIHPLFAFGIIFNLQNLLFTVKRIQYSLNTIDIKNLDEKTLEFGDKLSKSEHHKLNGLYLLIEHYFSITSFHDKFDSLKSIKRKEKDSKWIGLEVDKKVLKKQKWILEDLEYLRENELSIDEILKMNKLLIQELKSYFEFEKLNKKRKNN